MKPSGRGVKLTLVQIEKFLYVVAWTKKHWHSLVKFGWLDIENWLLPGAGQSTRFLDHIRHWVAFVHQPQLSKTENQKVNLFFSLSLGSFQTQSLFPSYLAIGWILRGGIHEYSTVLQCSVHVCNLISKIRLNKKIPKAWDEARGCLGTSGRIDRLWH